MGLQQSVYDYGTSIFEELTRDIALDNNTQVFAPANIIFTQTLPQTFNTDVETLKKYKEFDDVLKNHFSRSNIEAGTVTSINGNKFPKNMRTIDGVPIISEIRYGDRNITVYIIDGILITESQAAKLRDITTTSVNNAANTQLRSTMYSMDQMCDINGGYLYVDPKQTKTSFTFEKGKTNEDMLWKAEVTGGLRTNESYTRSMKQVLDIITVQDDILPVGSFKYNIHKYPGDVDIFEHLSVCCCIDDAKRVAVNRIQNMIKKVKAAPDVYLGDFKAGEDDRFAIEIGKWIDGVLVGYNESYVMDRINELYKNRLFSEDDYEKFMEYVVSNPTEDEWQKLKDFIRDFKVLRWNMEELLQGYKLLAGNVKLMLGDALSQQTLVKIDLWARINGKYIEFTNFFMISAVNKDGKRIYLLTQELPDYVSSISNDVAFYSSPDHRKTLKAIKRLWSLAIFKGDLALAERISPLFSTNAAALNQLEGEAEVLALMLEKLTLPPLKNIMDQLDSFKPRIDQLSTIPERNEELYKLIDATIDEYYANPTEYDKFEEAVENIKLLQKKLKDLVEDMIYAEAQNLGLENPAAFL